MATLTSVTSLTQTLSLENRTSSLRDVSFSSYLSNTEETYSRKLAESNPNIGNRGLAELHLSGRKKEKDEEIGVFSAEKYFKGGIDEDSPRLINIIPKNQPPKKDEQNDHLPSKPKIHPAAPSIHSESSWNSQTAFLQVGQRKSSQRKANKFYGKCGRNFLAGLGCKYCSCSDKDSIDVDDKHVGEISFNKNPNAVSGRLQDKAIAEELIKISALGHDLEQKPRSGSLFQEEIHCKNLDNLGIGLNKENCFSFRTSNSFSGNQPPNKLQLREAKVLNPRKSIEVFGSPVPDSKSKSFRIERRLSMLSWDAAAAAPRMEEIDYSAASRGGGYNDNESDASSDLFEIESLTGKVNPFARQGSDVTSDCVTPTTCYPPSEASIEWSVVTASAADFSVISDYEELRPTIAAPSPIKTFPTKLNAKTATSKEMPIIRRSPSILLGCNNHKAVKVAGDAHRQREKIEPDIRMRRVSDSYMPITRFPAETKLMEFDSSARQRAFSSNSLPRSHPSQSSHLLYIQ